MKASVAENVDGFVPTTVTFEHVEEFNALKYFKDYLTRQHYPDNQYYRVLVDLIGLIDLVQRKRNVQNTPSGFGTPW